GCNAACWRRPFCFDQGLRRCSGTSGQKWRRRRSSLLDLHTAVAVSMLPVSRLRACAVFRELRHNEPHTTVAHVLDALRVPAGDRCRLESEARSRTDAALTVGAATGMEAVAWFDSRYPALL